jgi:hypothetical protein
MFYSGTVNATGLTIIPTTGGLGTIASVWYTYYGGSGAAFGTGVVSLLGSSSVNLYNVGGNTLRLDFSGSGALTVSRTAGSYTYEVAFWVVWI